MAAIFLSLPAGINIYSQLLSRTITHWHLTISVSPTRNDLKLFGVRTFWPNRELCFWLNGRYTFSHLHLIALSVLFFCSGASGAKTQTRQTEAMHTNA